jgi:DNA mismatch endonuclease (patch repair protein)
MKRIRAKNTRPEVLLRSALHAKDLRYRVHFKDLPSTPDIVFTKARVAIFVNGCFWHQHQGCRDGRLPKSRLDYWGEKLRRNVLRDRNRVEQLLAMGWKVLIVWECEVHQQLDQVVATVVDVLQQHIRPGS